MIDPMRLAIAAATRPAEPIVVQQLLAEARLEPDRLQAARAVARTLVENLRARRRRSGGVDALMREFSLSSSEGVALMCLAEALLRIPDTATADALIRDKVSRGDWRAHLGRSQSLFVNAAAWGLMITGNLVATHSDEGLGRSLTQLIARGGEPLIRKGVDLAMRMLGQQFVTGQTIEEALANARGRCRLGYRYTFDMLGEAALTADDADAYFAAYRSAIGAIGATAGGLGAEAGPGISVKLSALHPRYCRAQRRRVLDELLPRLRELCRLAQEQDMGLAIDAEESERLDLSLELVEQLAADPAAASWNGLGVVVQSYQKRAPRVIDWLVELARRGRRRISVRLVKGAYWDSEIKRAQVEGQDGYPVFTRKAHTDVCYLACAHRLLAAADVIYPQFATHNALTLATVREMARAAGVTHYEFQCLHGMGETLYDQVLGADRLDVSCRIYAPVGSHETLLAYLVRRLLENGSNSSFVNQILDPAIGIDQLLRDPVEQAAADGGAPHPRIALPSDLYAPQRSNSSGIDLNDETSLAALEAHFARLGGQPWQATPMLAEGGAGGSEPRAVRNPARHEHVVGHVQYAGRADVEAALAAAQAFTTRWSDTSPGERARLLDRAAEMLEAHRAELMWLAVHEAGKTLANALGEVREAVDFCRYYASRLREEGSAFEGGQPLGVIACISPWNFPLAIFVGQVAAALAAGNVVLAKPAEQTPLAAARAVRLLHEAGFPRASLQLLPGDGHVGALLCADARVRGVLFTGSTEVAALIDRQLAARAVSGEIVLVAETGGINAMVADSSCLPEQVVADVLASAFDSAGQRCSALRVLCLQEEIADRVLAMLRGAMRELAVGDPARLSTDIGPVIDEEARARLESHVERMRAAQPVERLPLPATAAQGTFVAPTLIEIDSLAQLTGEVFGPVLHVLRFRRSDLGRLIDAINAAGYGLTFGVHSRIDETIDFVTARIRAGNLYVNRNMIGAVVGVQPFGGLGLSGTGPKAGGPWALHRLRRAMSAPALPQTESAAPPALAALQAWADASGRSELAARCKSLAKASPLSKSLELPGPTGESNRLRFIGRGLALCIAGDEREALHQIAAALATGNRVALAAPAAAALVGQLPEAVTRVVSAVHDISAVDCDVALCQPAQAAAVRRALAAGSGARVRTVTPNEADGEFPVEALVAEQTLSVNTAAAGGNASLMTLAPA